MASIYRTISKSFDLAQAILTPRMTDNRFNGQEQTKVATALTELARCQGMLDPATNLMEESQRQGCYDDLMAQLAILNPLETNKNLSVWEYYNALDLLTDAADDMLNGIAGRYSDLG